MTNSLATALWGANTVLNMLAQGIDGVSVHLRLKYLNSPVTASPTGGLIANPLDYGSSPAPSVRERRSCAWRAPVHPPTCPCGRSARAAGPRVLLVRIGTRGRGTVRRLTASSPSATTDLRFAGRSLNSAGQWTGVAHVERVRRSRGAFSVGLPRYSAALLTVTR